ncbi:proline-rich domain-containing protein [Siccirubricoccus phaeus]|uniref:proline-rich domain-containing protein n=1 Tax=Siccirubricoccus phaeus TaxID=2595053 RepID=UPI0011F167B3|nr:proline-rich domain-containing protein [Siccirubricoccus phaeus]
MTRDVTRRAMGVAAAGLVAAGLGAGLALAQGKSPLVGPPAAPPGSGKPAPSAPAPAPLPDKFSGAPPATPAPPAIVPDKFAAPPPGSAPAPQAGGTAPGGPEAGKLQPDASQPPAPQAGGAAPGVPQTGKPQPDPSQPPAPQAGGATPGGPQTGKPQPDASQPPVPQAGGAAPGGPQTGKPRPDASQPPAPQAGGTAPGGPQTGKRQPDASQPPAPRAAAPLPADAPDAVRRLHAMLGAEVSLTYREAIPPAEAGGPTRLAGVTLSRGDARVEVEEMLLEGVAEDRVGRLVATGLTLAGSPPAMLGRLTLEGFRLRRPAPGVSLAPGDLGLDRLVLEALAVQGEIPVSLEELRLEGWAEGRPGRFSLAGLDVLTPTAGVVDRVRLGRLALDGYDLPAILQAAIDRRPPPTPANAVAMELDDLAVSLGGQRLGGLGSFRLSADAPDAGVQAGRLALRDITLGEIPAMTPWMRRFGATEIQGEIVLEARLEPAAERLDLTSFTIAARGIGGLGLSVQMDGVNPDPARMAENAERLRLLGARLSYLDQSLYARLLADQARRQRVPEARLREQYANMAAQALGPEGRGALAPSLEAAQRFLRGQAQEVELVLRPPGPVPLTEMQAITAQGPAAVQQRLGLLVTAR